MTKDEESLAWKIMKYWGSEDCTFTRKEIAEIVGLPVKEVSRIITLVEKERPEIYEGKAKTRDELARQHTFERSMGKMDNQLMDQDLDSSRMDYEIPVSSKDRDYIIKKKLRRNKDDFGQGGEYEN